MPTLRFAAGNPKEPFSGVWRLVTYKDDVYIHASKLSSRFFKISLHKSGVWILAGTDESGATFDGNRRAMQWERPPEHAKGITRGPSILVPHTSLGSRTPSALEGNESVIWYAAPALGEIVYFSIYFVEPDIVPQWSSSQTVLGELGLTSGKRVILLASIEPSTADFMATVEKMIGEALFSRQEPGKVPGSHLWVTRSRDELATPMIIDIPIAVGPELSSG